MSNEISKSEGGALANVSPSWMNEDRGMGTKDLQKFTIPPRVVVIQPLAREPLNKYDPGTVLIMPGELVLGEYSKQDKCLKDPLVVVPLFFFAEYTLDNPREIWGNHGAVRDRSFEHDSELAIRSQNPKLRSFPCPELPSKMCSYTTRLHFIVRFMTDKISEPCLLTFKRAEMRSGMQLNSLIQSRKAPIFGCQFIFDVGYRSNDKGQWYGFEISNPPEAIGPWVQNKEVYEAFKAEHLRYAEAHAAKLLTPEYGAGDEEGASTPEF